MASTSSKQDSKAESRRQFEKYRNEYLETTPWKDNVVAKLNSAEPYNFFLTRIKDSSATYDEELSITFPELIDTSLGDLEHSVHINYMVDLQWLLAQYAVTERFRSPITLLYGVEDEDLQEIPPHLNISAVKIKPRHAFGHHHTKMSIFFYKDKSLRFAIYTANLLEADWENRVQGVWISPKCSYLGDGVPINYGESDTYFKLDMLQYLNSYESPLLHEWISRIQHADLSKIRIYLIASVPCCDTKTSFGYKKLQKILRQYVPENNSESWKLVAQCSSIGSLGPKPQSWLYSEFAGCLTGKWNLPSSSVQLIYPSVQNVLKSYDGILGGLCLPYQTGVHKKQPWLNNILCQWKSDHRHRTRAIPHIKTYTKINSSGTKLAWFLLTSANLSKAAWGVPNKSGSHELWSYEVGVLFLPQLLIKRDAFTIKKGGDFGKNNESFPIPYDVPLTPYSTSDEIFCCNKF